MNRQFRFLMLLAGALVVIGLLFPVMVAAGTPGYLQKIAPPDPQQVTGFGYDVLIDGDWLLVGTPYMDKLGNQTGGVYLYRWNGSSYVYHSLLLSPTPFVDQQFGVSLAIQGDTLVIGGSGLYDEPGRVYIYRRSDDTWVFKQEIKSPDPYSGQFGKSVDLDGNTLIIGDFTNDEGAFWAGAAFIYVWNGTAWEYQAKLKNPSPDSQDLIAHSVLVRGDLAVVGAYSEDIAVNEDGAAYIYRRSGTTWTLQQTLGAAVPVEGEMFGQGLAIQGDTLFIGAASFWYSEYGAVYVFKQIGATWVQQQRLIPTPQMKANNFGSSIAVDGNRLLVGSHGAAYVTNYAGAAYLFNYDGTSWVQSAVLTPPDGHHADRFGSDVAFHGSRLVVGAVYADTTQYNSGAVYVYQEGASDQTDLLMNGSFERDADNNFVPDGWTRKDTLVDARRCNQPGKPPVAYDGNCAYMFKGGVNSEARLFQTVNLNGYALKPGDKIKLTGFYHKQSAGTVYVRLFVNYATLPEDQGMVSMTKQTSGYQPIPALVKRLQAVPTRIHVLIQNKTTSGKTYVDGMSLKWVSKSGSGAIPLPPSADTLVPLPVAP